jgi:hypothetical protein
MTSVIKIVTVKNAPKLQQSGGVGEFDFSSASGRTLSFSCPGTNTGNSCQKPINAHIYYQHHLINAMSL